jgi:hypothetical protein
VPTTTVTGMHAPRARERVFTLLASQWSHAETCVFTDSFVT